MRRTLYALMVVLAALVLVACPDPSGLPDAPAPQPAIPYSPPPVSVIVIKMKPVLSGTFKRGPEAEDTSYVTGFQMSETEITVKQFTAVTGLALPGNAFEDVPDVPAHNVNWYHALVFCNRLSMLESLTPVYSIDGSTDPADWGEVPVDDPNALWDAATALWSASGYRLPTEMEWWWAAMGGIDQPLAMFAGWDGANDAGDFSWNWDNSDAGAHTAGTKAPNALGFYDLSGNVMEWCWDCFAPYPSGPLSDYRGPDGTDDRVRKGGSFKSSPGSALSPAARDASQDWEHQYSYNTDIGFRIVKK